MTIVHEVNVVIMLNMILQKIPPDVISLDKKIPRCHSLTRIQSPMMSLLHYPTLHSRFSVPVPNFTHTHGSIMSPPRHPRVLARVTHWQLSKPINSGESCSVWNGLIRVNKPTLVVNKLFPRKRGQRKKITLSRGLGKDFEYINISIKCDSQGWLVGKNQNGRYETQNTRAKINSLLIF